MAAPPAGGYVARTLHLACPCRFRTWQSPTAAMRQLSHWDGERPRGSLQREAIKRRHRCLAPRSVWRRRDMHAVRRLKSRWGGGAGWPRGGAVPAWCHSSNCTWQPTRSACCHSPRCQTCTYAAAITVVEQQPRRWRAREHGESTQCAYWGTATPTRSCRPYRPSPAATACAMRDVLSHMFMPQPPPNSEKKRGAGRLWR